MDDIQQATQRFLPPGFKPEDYYVVDPKLPFRIAQLIALEVRHMRNMRELDKRLTKLENRKRFYHG